MYTNQNVSTFAGAFCLINLRVGLPPNQHIRHLDHAAGNIGMDVQLCQDRHLRPNQFSHGC